MTDKFKNEIDATDGFFAPIGNAKPWFKMNLFGFAGSGKSYTAALTAVGLHQRIKSQKPVIMFDTETSSKFLKPMFEAAGIAVLVRESRSLADLKETMKRCREGLSDILLVDSLSHVWESFLEAYKQAPTKYGRGAKTRLEFQDWGIIKPTWKAEFSDPFVRDPVHMIVTGRAGYEYENEINKDTGKREIFKSGVKEKVEGETAYESDLLVLMERLQEMEGGEIKRVMRRAVVIKDRSTLLDGKTFENPAFEDFAPAVDIILKDPIKREQTAELDAAELVKVEDGRREWVRRKDIALEKIEAYLVAVWPGQTSEMKQLKVGALESAFGTPSWTEISGMKPETLEAGLTKLHEFVEKIIASKKVAEAEAEESPAKKAMKAGIAKGKAAFEAEKEKMSA